MSDNLALRFAHPDLDRGAAGFHLTPVHGHLEVVDHDDAVRQAILLLLSTKRGERVMLPDYGCDLHQLIFAANDETTAALAIHYVRRALDRWEPRIDILALDATPDPDNGLLLISLEYKVRVTQQTDTITFGFHLE